MKQLTCEMCGSTDLVKQDGVYVCQTCGTKYSVEEAKKMMVEGTVEVAGTVKVDDSAKIGNYYTMAKNAYDAGNKQEAESYCNKIIEIDPADYMAWFLKGKAAGWQSTLANLRIEESVNCFSKAIDNAPENEVDGIKNDAASEISSLSQALMSLCCNNFAKFPSNDNKDRILNNLNMCKLYSLLLLSKCGVAPTEFYKNIATMMNNAAMDAWNNVITKDYNRNAQPSDYVWETFTNRSLSCISLLETAISLSDDDDQEDVVRYKNLIFITNQLESSRSYAGGYVNKTFNAETKEHFINKVMQYHEKIKEIDPSYEIPQRRTPSKNGCYVATAVYSSYDCPQVWTLRRFRDYTLAKTWYGRTFIRLYYAISPTLVKWFGHTAWFRKMWKGRLDRMVMNLNAAGVEDTFYEDKVW
ncbi:MAG: TFIIB-type zinc finger domain-containing protein [Lachnospiraceae bacterium]|nr:TFIIB-type zinc finger domain-containing protein [Lachnospiraceae bacterium]